MSISPLQVETTEEKRLFALGEKNYNSKKDLAKTNLRKQAPNDLESDLIHAMWLKELDCHGERRSLMLITSFDAPKFTADLSLSNTYAVYKAINYQLSRPPIQYTWINHECIQPKLCNRNTATGTIS